MGFFRKNKKDKIIKEKKQIDVILPLYLNQRFVYDILAIKNDGFTEFYEVKDQKGQSNEMNSNVNATLGTNNEFALIKAGVESEVGATIKNDKNNEKIYKKTHTPTSLFMQVYQYLKNNQKIKNIDSIDCLDKICSGDFVEIKSSIELNTIVEFFETFDKVIDITDAIAGLAVDNSSKKTISRSVLSNFKKPVENIIKTLKDENNDVKYGICRVDEKEIVLKLNKDYFINSDYSEIKNGEFRIIGKVLEIVPEGETVLLNRDNAIRVYDFEMFNPVREALDNMPNIHFDKFKDKVEGKTCIIMPIAIGI